MAQSKNRAVIGAVVLVLGIILLGMYAVLTFAGGRPSIGMLVVGLSNTVVGTVLIRRTLAARAS